MLYTKCTRGFVKRLAKGVYESGKGILLFLGDLLTHPIRIAAQNTMRSKRLLDWLFEDQWGVIGEGVSPEIHPLVTQVGYSSCR